MSDEQDHDAKPLSVDDLIKKGIMERQDEGLFAVAWAVIKLTDVISTHVSNEAIRHTNETYIQKQTANDISTITSRISDVVSALNNGKYEITKKPY